MWPIITNGRELLQCNSTIASLKRKSKSEDRISDGKKLKPIENSQNKNDTHQNNENKNNNNNNKSSSGKSNNTESAKNGNSEIIGCRSVK